MHDKSDKMVHERTVDSQVSKISKNLNYKYIFKKIKHDFLNCVLIRTLNYS